MIATMTRPLGRSGIQVSAQGLGCWAIGGPFNAPDGRPVGWGQVDDNESIRAIHRGLELGVNFLDTADVYGTGHSEEVVAHALAGRREQVVIATKFGNVFEASQRQITGEDASPAYIRQACEASLRRLNTDYIDLYQLHIGGYDIDAALEVRETLEALAVEGKIRAYGWSTDSVERAQLFADGAHCTAIQLQMNVLDDAASMVALCERENLAAILRGPLAMGLLTGKFTATTTLTGDDVRGDQGPEWMRYFQNGKPHPIWLEKMERVRGILTQDGRTLVQGALGWLWARSPLTIPIPGFRTVAQVEENAGAFRFGALTADQMQAIEQVLERAGA